MNRRPLIDMNFATRDYRLSLLAVRGLAAFAAFLLVAAVLLGWGILAHRAERSAIGRQTAELNARNGQIAGVLEERDRLLKELASMAALVEARRFSWTGLLTSIEQVFPTGVALDRVQYHPKDRSLILEGRAQSPESLRGLMVGLERSPAFASSQLKHQSIEKGVISFTVGVRCR